MTPRLLKTGDIVRVRQVGDTDWTVAKVALASGNGKSVALSLDDCVGAGEGFYMRRPAVVHRLRDGDRGWPDRPRI